MHVNTPHRLLASAIRFLCENQLSIMPYSSLLGLADCSCSVRIRHCICIGACLQLIACPPPTCMTRMQHSTFLIARMRVIAAHTRASVARDVLTIVKPVVCERYLTGKRARQHVPGMPLSRSDTLFKDPPTCAQPTSPKFTARDSRMIECSSPSETPGFSLSSLNIISTSRYRL